MIALSQQWYCVRIADGLHFVSRDVRMIFVGEHKLEQRVLSLSQSHICPSCGVTPLSACMPHGGASVLSCASQQIMGAWSASRMKCCLLIGQTPVRRYQSASWLADVVALDYALDSSKFDVLVALLLL